MSAAIPAKKSSILCTALSALGSAPSVCHSVCLGIVTILASLGLTLNILPLMFAVTYQKYFWIAGIIFLALGFLAYRSHQTPLTKNLLFMNAGLLLAAYPWMPNIIGVRLVLQWFGYAVVIIAIGAIIMYNRWLTLRKVFSAALLVLIVYNQWLIAEVKKDFTIAPARAAAVTAPPTSDTMVGTMSAAEHNSHHQ